MSTTTSATGQRPDEDGIYWHEWAGMPPELLLVRGGLVFDFGDSEGTSVGYFNGKWSGPVTFTDFEQLAALRVAAIKAIDVLGMEFPGSLQRKAAIAALRNALETTERGVK